MQESLRLLNLRQETWIPNLPQFCCFHLRFKTAIQLSAASTTVWSYILVTWRSWGWNVFVGRVSFPPSHSIYFLLLTNHTFYFKQVVSWIRGISVISVLDSGRESLAVKNHCHSTRAKLQSALAGTALRAWRLSAARGSNPGRSALHIFLLPGGGERLPAGCRQGAQNTAGAWGHASSSRNDKRVVAKGQKVQDQPWPTLHLLNTLYLVPPPKGSSVLGPQDNFRGRGKLGGYSSPFEG